MVKKLFKWIGKLIKRVPWTFWENFGFFVVPDHFYNPIPGTVELREKQPWNQRYPTKGIDLREDYQLQLLDEFASYTTEYTPTASPFESNGDGPVLYSMVRRCKPDRIVEVGSGASTRVSLEASQVNATKSNEETDVIAIEPYPGDKLKRLEAERDNLTLWKTRAEDIEVKNYVSLLKKGDFLFIDSSHVSRVGNDVNHLYLKVLPYIPVGVYVHVHDIRFPFEYPKKWLLENHMFWSEQYLLQSFLMFNESYEVVWAGNYMSEEHGKKLEKVLPNYKFEDGWPGSFWIRRTE